MIMNDNEILLNITVGEFRQYCKRMCGLCNIKRQIYLKGDRRSSRNERAGCCPFLQIRAWIDLMKEGGMDKVSKQHLKRTLELAAEINISNKGGSGQPVYIRNSVLSWRRMK